MNRLIAFTFVLFLLLGCQADEEPIVSISDNLQNCGIGGIFSPEGYLVNLLGGIEQDDYNAREFHFVDDFNGFMIAFDKSQGKSVLLKTDDGGVKWANTILPKAGDIEVSSLPVILNMKSIIFKDNENASLFTTTSVMFKTMNTGKTWSYHGTMKDLQHYSYAYDLLYASNYDGKIFVSKNDGETWTLLSDHPSFYFNSTRFSFKIIGDKIYAKAEDNKLIVLNLDGEFLEELQLNIGSINDIHSNDENTFILSSYEKVLITTDGGASFSTYYDGDAEMISFLSPDEAIMIIKTGGSNGDAFYTCDEIAYTTNGGISWISSGTCSMDLMSAMLGAQTINKDRSICLFRNCIYEIKRIL